MTKEELTTAVSELVWEAWFAGMRAANAMSSERAANEEHMVIWEKLQKLERALTIGE